MLAWGSEGRAEERDGAECMATHELHACDKSLLNNVIQAAKHWLVRAINVVRQCITLARQSLLLFWCPDWWAWHDLATSLAGDHRHNLGMYTKVFTQPALISCQYMHLLFIQSAKYVLILVIEKVHILVYTLMIIILARPIGVL